MNAKEKADELVEKFVLGSRIENSIIAVNEIIDLLDKIKKKGSCPEVDITYWKSVKKYLTLYK